MSKMEKLLAIASIGQRTYSKWLFQRLVPTIVLIAALTIVIGTIVGMMLVGGFYLYYESLITSGVDPTSAITVIIAWAVTAIMIFSIVIFYCFCHLRKMPQKFLKKSSCNHVIAGVISAFLDGFMADKSDRR